MPAPVVTTISAPDVTALVGGESSVGASSRQQQLLNVSKLGSGDNLKALSPRNSGALTLSPSALSQHRSSDRAIGQAALDAPSSPSGRRLSSSMSGAAHRTPTLAPLAVLEPEKRVHVCEQCKSENTISAAQCAQCKHWF